MMWRLAGLRTTDGPEEGESNSDNPYLLYFAIDSELGILQTKLTITFTVHNIRRK